MQVTHPRSSLEKLLMTCYKKKNKKIKGKRTQGARGEMLWAQRRYRDADASAHS